MIKTNLELSLKLYELAEESNIKYFLNSDSYWSKNAKTLEESINLYAYLKKIFTEILKTNSEKNQKIKTINLRFFHVFGENDNPKKFIPQVIKKFQKDEELNMTSGEQKLDFIYVKEACKIINFILKKINSYEKQYTEIEIGSGQQISLKSFIEEIQKKMLSKSKINFGKIEPRRNEVMSAKANLDALQNYQFHYSLDQAINQTINGYQ